jgi:nucleoside-diphosphate-sugar epimerase
MKILVIGNGFIATPLIQKLESEGHELLIYSKTLNENIKSQQVLGDIFLFEDFVKTLLWKPQIIIHTAWITTFSRYKNDLSNYRYAQFTSDLAKHIALTDIESLIILGTCAEYGHQTKASNAGITKLSPVNLYAQQKVSAFNSVKEILDGSSVRLTWARIFQPYGPRQDKDRLIPYLIHSLKIGAHIQLGDTSSIHDWITTRDIASAISWVISHQVSMEVDVGTTFGYTNVEILKELEELLGNSTQWKEFATLKYGSNELSIVGKDSPLLKSGWAPLDSLHTGLEWVLSS